MAQTKIERLWTDINGFISFGYTPNAGTLASQLLAYLRSYTRDGGFAPIISDYENRLQSKNTTVSEDASYRKIVETCSEKLAGWRILLGLDIAGVGPKQAQTNKYGVKGTYSSYAGTDIIASITLPDFGSKPKVIGELQTISYSIHREVSPVRTLSRINPVGFTAGARTIAGSLIFTVFDRNMVYAIKEIINDAFNPSEATAASRKYKSKYGFREKDALSEYSVMDEMPPFDVTITFNNEYGGNSILVIKGIVIVDEGQVMSIEDLITENTVSYMAQDIRVMESKVNKIMPPSVTKTTTTTQPVTTLDNIIVSKGVLSPPFDKNTYSYIVALPEAEVVVPTVTGVPSHYAQQLTVSNATSLPGTTTITVRGSDGATVTKYNLGFTKLSSDATISSIRVGPNYIQNFSPLTTDYTITLPYGTTTIPVITGTPTNIRSKVDTYKAAALPGTTTLKVTAQDSVTEKRYYIHFNVAAPDTNNFLKSFTTGAGIVSPIFDPGIYAYTITLPYGSVTIPNIVAIAESSKSKVDIIKPNDLSSPLKVEVTAQNGVKKTYTFNFALWPKPFSKVFMDKVSGSAVTAEGYVIYVYEDTGNALLLDCYGGNADDLAEHCILVTKPDGFSYTVDTTVTVSGVYNGRTPVEKGFQTYDMRKVTATSASL